MLMMIPAGIEEKFANPSDSAFVVSRESKD